jgi:3-oxoacyl-[acyl-carrier-protein] synthase-3
MTSPLPASPWSAKITGTGSAFPANRVTNEDLSRRLETSDQWIRERTGIVERRISEHGNPEELNSALGHKAALRALEMAGKKPEDIDQILYATCTPDTLIPSTACWLQKKLGAKRAWAMDLNAACTGFVYALATADAAIRSGQSKLTLVVGADVLSAFTNWEDRTSCILFADGAGAAVIERTNAGDKHRILSTHLGSDGELWDLFHIPAGGSALELTPEAHQKHLGKMHMKGTEIFKIAVRTLADFAETALAQNGYKASDVDWLVPHQANIRIMEAVAKRIGIPVEKVLINIGKFGNTSAATIPTVLDEGVRSGRVKPGQLLLLDAFGAGVTYGSALVRW